MKHQTKSFWRSSIEALIEVNPDKSLVKLSRYTCSNPSSLVVVLLTSENIFCLSSVASTRKLILLISAISLPLIINSTEFRREEDLISEIRAETSLVI